MDWIDAHCHLADRRIGTTLAAVLERSRAAGVATWIQGGVSPEDWVRQLELRAQFGDAVVPVFGLHPWWVSHATDAQSEAALVTLSALVEKAAAIGELGLDAGPRHAAPDARARQRRAFARQLELAKLYGKPMVLHIVKAHPVALEMLEKAAPFSAGGIVHSFSAGREVARAYMELGFHVSIGGSVTRDGFQALKKAVASLPSERLVVETDAPDQTPKLPGLEPRDLNEPAHLLGIARAVGWLRGESQERILTQSAESLRKLFGLGLK